MNIPFGKAPSPAAGMVAARAAPLPKAGGSREAGAVPAPTQPLAVESAAASLKIDALKQVASQINHFLRSSSSSLQFAVDNDTRKVVVRIVDSETSEVIRQIPSEEMVAMSKAMDRLSGLLIRQEA